MRSFVAAVSTALAAAAGVAAAATTCDTSSYITVDTSNGPVTGHPAPNSACVIEYLGVPYAKPPVGDLRFAAPEPLTETAAYNASEFGYDCPLSPAGPLDYPDTTPQAPQIVSYFASAAGTPQSEDCLTLNIWSKVTERSDQAAKPVLVFFYGGRFAIGNTNSPFYNGKYFADAQDIIVVTVNYRVNIFGFPGAPGEAQNLGLRDQRAAVEWLRDNISGFGGDPDKITISGQSSGGVAVDYWTYAYRDDPIIHGIIAPSGNAFSFPVNRPGVPEKNWNLVVEDVECADASDVMACMREVDWEDIKAAAAKVPPSRSSSVLRSIPPFYPMPDNELVFSDYLSRAENGKFLKVPILVGNTHNEDGYYRIPAWRQGVVPTPSQVESFLLESFTCPVSVAATARLAQCVPSWAYRYFADWDNTRLFPTSGAYHGVDLHMIFDASEDVSGIPPEADQEALTELMQRAWFAFSDDPWNGLTNELGWPTFNPGRKSLVLLGKDNSPEPDFVYPVEYDDDCPIVTMGGLA